VLCRPRPSMAGTSAQHAGARGNGSPLGVLDLHVGCRSLRVASGSPEAPRRRKALRVVKCRHRSCGPAGSDSLGSVRGKPVRVRSRDNTPPHRANPGDPKRVKRHERDTRRASAKTRCSVDPVKLGYSFFEKWVVRLKNGRISRRRRPLVGANFEATSTPASRSRRSATVRVGAKGAARRGPSCSHGPNPDASGGSNRRFEPPGRGASSALLRTAKPGAAGGCSGQSGSSVPFGARS
jgi:hypothetical protein